MFEVERRGRENLPKASSSEGPSSAGERASHVAPLLSAIATGASAHPPTPKRSAFILFKTCVSTVSHGLRCLGMATSLTKQSFLLLC